jgi:hypothetical protein
VIILKEKMKGENVSQAHTLQAYDMKGNWIAKSPRYEPIIAAVFNLFPKYENYEAVRKTINETTPIN